MNSLIKRFTRTARIGFDSGTLLKYLFIQIEGR